jgi:uncharacterized membrane protein YgcG
MKITCPGCGKSVGELKRFCSYCGTDIHKFIASMETDIEGKLEANRPKVLVEETVPEKEVVKAPNKKPKLNEEQQSRLHALRSHFLELFFTTSIFCFVITLFLIGGLIMENDKTDLIRLFQLDVNVLPDASLENTYYLEWEFLTEIKDEPLYIGLPHTDVRIVPQSWGSDVYNVTVSTEYNGNNGAWAKVQLSKNYYAAHEIVKIKFTVNQSRMIYGGRFQNTYSYDFVPSWFDEIKILRYDFRWRSDFPVYETNADHRNANNNYSWTGSLNPGEYVHLIVDYLSSYFPETNASGKPPVLNKTLNYSDVWIILGLVLDALIFGLIYFFIIRQYLRYKKGSGFTLVNGEWKILNNYPSWSGSGGHGGGGGGGCAGGGGGSCAGGGRAGCSLKDFVKPQNHKPSAFN